MKMICRTAKLYLHYVSINVRCMMEYKTSFLLTAIGQFLVSFNVFLGIFFMFQRFSTISARANSSRMIEKHNSTSL